MPIGSYRESSPLDLARYITGAGWLFKRSRRRELERQREEDRKRRRLAEIERRQRTADLYAETVPDLIQKFLPPDKFAAIVDLADPLKTAIGAEFSVGAAPYARATGEATGQAGFKEAEAGVKRGKAENKFLTALSGLSKASPPGSRERVLGYGIGATGPGPFVNQSLNADAVQSAAGNEALGNALTDIVVGSKGNLSSEDIKNMLRLAELTRGQGVVDRLFKGGGGGGGDQTLGQTPPAAVEYGGTGESAGTSALDKAFPKKENTDSGFEYYIAPDVPKPSTTTLQDLVTGGLRLPTKPTGRRGGAALPAFPPTVVGDRLKDIDPRLLELLLQLNQ